VTDRDDVEPDGETDDDAVEAIGNNGPGGNGPGGEGPGGGNGPGGEGPGGNGPGGEGPGGEGGVVDELPEDLQPHLVDPEDYLFPNNDRRRIPGYLYLATAVILVLVVLVWGDSAYVNRGYLGAAAVIAAFGAYSIASGWSLDVDERDALVASIAAVGFPVGHASAQMGWRGLLSRPTWRMLLYSADEPPSKRAFALIDGVDGSVVECFVEDNPEDWSDLEPEATTAVSGGDAAAPGGDEGVSGGDEGVPGDDEGVA
jgi:hypothetical protein